MEHTFAASTVESDDKGFESLQDKLLARQSEKSESGKTQEETAPREKDERLTNPQKKFVFQKGDQSVELDDDFEIEFMADKRPTKLTLRELKERAAGDIAVKNRMHSLSEEKKKVQSTFRQFAELSKTDPLAALEFIASKAKESDSEFAYEKYIAKLAEQAEQIGQMDDKERRAFEAEKKLKKAEQDLSQKSREQAVVLRKQEMLTDYPEIGDSQFAQMVDAVLSNEELSEGLDDENDVMNKVEELIQETLTQRDIMSLIQEINPQHVNDQNLIFSLSDQLRQHPDLDEEDVRDILSQLIVPGETVGKPVDKQRQRDAQILSDKVRQSMPTSSLRQQNATDFQILSQRLIERNKDPKKTSRYDR